MHIMYPLAHGLRTSNEAFFHAFLLEQTIWPDKFWGMWDIFEQFISTHFGTVSPLSMFSINQQLFLQKIKHLYPHIKYLFGIGI